MPISNKLIDQLRQDYNLSNDLLGGSGLLKELTQRLAKKFLKPR